MSDHKPESDSTAACRCFAVMSRRRISSRRATTPPAIAGESSSGATCRSSDALVRPNRPSCASSIPMITSKGSSPIFDLLKSHVHGQLTGHCVGSLISRAVTVLSADMLIDRAVPMFRDGSCSRAHVCRDGRLLGRLSRTNVFRHLAQRELNVPSKESSPVLVATSAGLLSTIDTHETTPRAPQFMTPLPTSVLGGICVATPRLSSR